MRANYSVLSFFLVLSLSFCLAAQTSAKEEQPSSYETRISQRDTKGYENVIARSFSDEAISKKEIATPSARNDRIKVFSGENVIPRFNRGIQEALNSLDSRLRGNDGLDEFSAEKIAISLLLNGEEKGEAFAVLTPDNDILLTTSDLKELGVTLPGKEIIIEETTYVSLRSLSPQVRFELNEKELRLNITAEPAVFEGSALDLHGREVKGMLYPKQNSAFLNYSLDLSMADDFDYSGLNAPFEIGVRKGEYLIFSNFSYSKQKNDENFARLFSNIIRDDKVSMRRYTAGDFNASTGELGGGAMLGGINISKNFGLNPYFLRYPGINLSGLLYTTSDVELWAEGRVISRQRLSPGKFEFQNIPATTGIGEAEIVIRDAFGKEQKVIVPFYFSSMLLKKGLHEYSYSAGFTRENFGTENFRYDKPVLLLTHKYGLTDRFTGGMRLETDKDMVSSGVSSHFIIEGLGFFDIALAYSINHTNGHAYSLGYSYNIRKKGLGFRLTVRGHSQNYSNLTLSPEKDRPKTEIISSVVYSSERLGSLSLFYTASNNYLSDDLKKFTVRYTRRLVKNLNMDITASKTKSDKTTNELFITLRYIFGRTTSGSLTYQTTENVAGGIITVQRTPPEQKGIGYKVYAEKKEDTPEVYDTELSYNGRYGIYSGRYRTSDSDDTSNLKVSGSIGMANSSVHFGQPIYDSFAIVKIGDLRDVNVYSGNTLVDKTDSRGEVLITRIQSHGDNKIFVNDKDIPLGYSLKSFTKHISPPFRSGTFVELESEKMQAITGNIFIVEGGEKKPAEFWQLIINVGGESVGSPVVKEGEFYLENIPSGKYNATIKKRDRECSFEMVIPVSTEPMINLGEVICEISPVE